MKQDTKFFATLSILTALYGAGCAATGEEPGDLADVEVADDALRTSEFVGTWRDRGGDAFLSRNLDGTVQRNSELIDGSPSGFELQVYADNSYIVTIYRCDQAGAHCAPLPLAEARESLVPTSRYAGLVGVRGKWSRSLLRIDGGGFGGAPGLPVLSRPLVLKGAHDSAGDKQAARLFNFGVVNGETRARLVLGNGQFDATYIPFTRSSDLTSVVAD